jgi:protein phosphatase
MSPLAVRVTSASDVGRVRSGNEDSMLVQPPVFAVADGMGGHLGGEVASSIAVEVIGAKMRRSGPDALSDAVQEANAAVFERQIRDRSVAGMGTTVTAVCLDGDSLRIAHVGDSRAYLFRGGELTQLSTDHTLVNDMVRDGAISESEARVHPQRSILTRALGIDQRIAVDTDVLDIREGDRILLCSDGLNSMIEDDVIRRALSDGAEANETVAALVEAANEAGGLDNITVVLLDFVADEEGEGGGAGASSATESDPDAGPATRRRRRR